MASPAAASFEKCPYPYPIKFKLRDFVPIKLSGSSSYSKWRKLMLRLLETQALVVFINGKISAPVETMEEADVDERGTAKGTKLIENPDYRAWKKSDALVQSWIIGTISEDALEILEDLRTAQTMWTTLEMVFTDISQLRTKIEYPYPSEVRVREFVPIKLHERSYPIWRHLMLSLVEAQGLAGLLNGGVPPPAATITIPNVSSTTSSQTDTNKSTASVGAEDSSDASTEEEIEITADEKPMKNTLAGDRPNTITNELENPDYKAWKRSNVLLQSWIIGTMDESLVAQVAGCKTARGMWMKLERMLKGSDSETEFPSSSSDSHTETTRTDSDTGGSSGTDAKVSGEDLKLYEPLHRATVRGDWESALAFLKAKPEAVRAKINPSSETALMIAVLSPRRNHFVKKLVEFMSPEDLTVTDPDKDTALHRAALEGNLQAAKWLVAKNPKLPNISSHGYPALSHAAGAGYRDLTLYLLEVTDETIKSQLFQTRKGARVLGDLVKNGLFDIALSLVRRYKLRREEFVLLPLISTDPLAYPSGEPFNWWQTLIYKYAPSKAQDPVCHRHGGDIENPVTVNYHSFVSGRQLLFLMFWNVAALLVPQMKEIQEKKLMHTQALELLKYVCDEVGKIEDISTASEMIGKPLMAAANDGIYEVVEEILASFPNISHQYTGQLYKMIHYAISNRNEKAFNLIYQFSDQIIDLYLSRYSPSGDTSLHLAGLLGHEQRLKLGLDAAGAALQMQRESLHLQWFKEVERLLRPMNCQIKNREQKTALTVFQETHQDLAKEGEKWMKDTATSCSIVAALIVTVTFAAAITVPGGNDDENGLPIFSKNAVFKIFGISDAHALFTSTSSVLMFLSILTCRYSERDFLHALPRKLIIGLLTLFIPIISMIVAFSATFYLFFGEKKIWTLIPVIVFSCIPGYLFASLQFPLLFEMTKSTYFSRIFHKQRDRMFM